MRIECTTELVKDETKRRPSTITFISKHHLVIPSRQTVRMIICPACRCVHDEGGDCISSRQFDDLTLWNRSLTQGEIRALNYLDRGLNGIVVPRGLFFQSQFFSNLNTTSFSYLSPLIGSIVMGNDNPLELNARTIQQLIAANLLLEDGRT